MGIELFLAFSLHLGLTEDYNSVHPHARCQVDNTVFGTYYNSMDRVSVYAGKKINNWELGFTTGYLYDVVPFARYKQDNFFIAPAYETNDNIGVTVGYELQLY